MKNIMNLVGMSFNNFISIKKMPLFIVLAFCVSSLFNTQFLTMLIGIITYVVAYQTIAYEDSYGIDYMITHLPVTKNEYVISRYVFSILSIVVSSVLASIIYFISTKMNLADLGGIDYKTILFMGILSGIVLISVSTPVLLYFGVKKARMAMIIIFMIIVMIPSVSINDSQILVYILNKLNEVSVGIFEIVILLVSYFISILSYEKKEID